MAPVPFLLNSILWRVLAGIVGLFSVVIYWGIYGAEPKSRRGIAPAFAIEAQPLWLSQCLRSDAPIG
jgi:hypothetical protein